MSYDLSIFYSAHPMTAREAAQRYRALCERPLNTPGALEGLIEPDRRVGAFAAEMTALYPPLSLTSDDEDDLCPWSCDPDISEGHVIVSVRWSRCQQMAQTLTEMAWRYDLIVYSPQDDKVYPPPAVPVP
jgi:hypothetical protein